MLHIRRLAHVLPAKCQREEVVLVGNDFWKLIFRFVVSLSMIVTVLLLTAPKACWPPGWHPSG